MSNPQAQILEFLQSQFEPFFREDILQELEIPEEIDMSYEFLNGLKINMNICTDMLRGIKQETDLSQNLNHYRRVNFPIAGVSLWQKEGFLVTVAADYIRFSSMNALTADQVGCLELWVYTKNSEKYTKGDLVFIATYINQEIISIEYGECRKQGKFSSFDTKDRIRNPQTVEEIHPIREETEKWFEEPNLSDTPTRYLGTLIAITDML